MLKCLNCGKELTDGLTLTVCDDCLEDYKFEYRHSPEKCYNLSKGRETQISINSFLLSQYSKEDIETLLLSQLKWEAETPYSDYIDFIEEDISWFAESVSKGGEN